MSVKQIGIIDIGTNTIRLVIFSADKNGSVTEIENLKINAKLGNYINDEGALTEAGILLIINSLRYFSRIIHQYKSLECKAIATAAVRNASNREDILKTINNKQPIQVEVLSEQEEAYYGYLSVIHSTNINDGVIVDLGGGSTEVSFMKDRKFQSSCSLPFGALTLKKKFIYNNKIETEEIISIREYIKKQLYQTAFLPEEKLPIIGIGGSFKNMASIHHHLAGSSMPIVNQYKMKLQEIKQTNKKLMSLSYKERKKLNGLSKSRRNTITPAGIIMEELAMYILSDTFIINTKGIREGILYEILYN